MKRVPVMHVLKTLFYETQRHFYFLSGLKRVCSVLSKSELHVDPFLYI